MIKKEEPIEQNQPLQPKGEYKPLSPTKPTEETKATPVGAKPNAVQNKSRAGALNPFSNHKHSDESKARISTAQKERYQTIRDQISEEHITRIVENVIEKYLRKTLI